MGFLSNTSNNIGVGLKYYSFKLASYLADRLPLRFSYWVAKLVGDAIYLTWRRHSANAVSNMRRVLGPEAPWQMVKHTARRSFRNYAKTIVDFFRYPYMEGEDVRVAVPLRYGIEHLLEAYDRGKGVLLVTGHVGNWDLAGAVLMSYGLPVSAVADSFEPERLDDLINGSRERKGMKIIKLDTSSLRGIFTALKKGETVSLMIDRPEDEKGGVPVEFFGETAYMPAGPAAIALKTGAAVLVGYCMRRPGDKTFYGAVEPAIDYEHHLTGDKQRDIQMITQMIVNTIEDVIRRHPDQWYMFREMWPRTDEHDAEVKQKRFWGGKGNVSMASS
jgi:KDO2-lipid IV(A) lauroyltransferase